MSDYYPPTQDMQFVIEEIAGLPAINVLAGFEDASSDLVEAVLAPGVAPDHKGANRLLGQLKDPDYYSPALTPEHVARVQTLCRELGIDVARISPRKMPATLTVTPPLQTADVR